MANITYKELREKIIEFNKKNAPYSTQIERDPLINDGFPGTFNMSFAEAQWLKKFGGYTNWNGDFKFSTIQSCIRVNDLLNNVCSENYWKYLGVFEMADLGGMNALLKRPENYLNIRRKAILSLIDFLTSFGLDRNRIYPSYSRGGKISELSEGKYSFEFDIPADESALENFIEAGIPKENIISDNTRDTFLCLHLGRPTPWGYRNEINYNLGTKEKPVFIDLATVECLIWKPVFKGDDSLSTNIVNLIPFESLFIATGLGPERLCMVINGFEKVQDNDHLKPFYDKLKSFIKNIKNEKLVEIGENLRAVHRIYSDIYGYHLNKKISDRRREKLAKMTKPIRVSGLNELQIKELLTLLAKNQPWHDNLEMGIEPTIEKINRSGN